MMSIRIKQSIDAESSEFNTCFHTQQEAPHLSEPDDSPYDYRHWLPLIALSQQIPLHAIPVIPLSRHHGALLIAASQSSLITRQMNRLFQEEINEDIAPLFRPLTYLPNGYFARLDGCSPKDGVSGTQPITCAQDIILRLITSKRAISSITQILEEDDGLNSDVDEDEDEDSRDRIRLYFLPYNPRMSTAREYRVFCPPPLGRMAAISQYKWHEASMFAGRAGKEREVIMTRIAEEAQVIHKAILGTNPEAARSVLLRKQGFSFDVMYDEDTERCCLIELNCFGTRSGCGSCLFHWLRDEEVLYGRVSGDVSDGKGEIGDGGLVVEFRISV